MMAVDQHQCRLLMAEFPDLIERQQPRDCRVFTAPKLRWAARKRTDCFEKLALFIVTQRLFGLSTKRARCSFGLSDAAGNLMGWMLKRANGWTFYWPRRA